MAKTNYLEDAMINFFLRNDADTFTPPATVYVALLTAVSDAEAGPVTEVSGGAGYARVSCAFADPAGTGVTSNSAEVAFGESTGANGTVTHFALYDASSAGNALYIGSVDTPFAYSTGVLPRFAAGALDVTEE
jgi:hypothetical protein